MRAVAAGGAAALLVALLGAPGAGADPGPLPIPGGGAGGLGGGPIVGGGGGALGIGGGPVLTPAASSALFLCPGDGFAFNVLGGGFGACDFDFQPVALPGPPGFGTMHTHCEFGGFSPIAAAWQCWRVFPGQPDHPRLFDPDIIPDGYGVPWAINGPTPQDQWPPLGLAPAAPPPESPPP